MVNNFIQHKYDAMVLYRTFLPIITKVKNGMPTSYDNTLEFLKKRAENIMQDKFILMIAGEAKSGKSTFINAYLGKEILPMDVKQCTSAIVEICYGESYILRATFADGREEIYNEEAEIKEFLRKNAAMADAYRKIPVTILNMNLIAAKKGEQITDTEIDRWITALQGENLYHLESTEYSNLIRQYIREMQPKWRTIVKKMQIRYPFEDPDMKGIRIIDTPGVNAEGQLGKITDEYMLNANAIMFLKPLPGAAMESSSFRKFLESRSADRNKGAKFLILTRYTNVTPEEAAELRSEAVKQYPDVDEKQIISVDSKVELYWNKFQKMTTEEINAFLMKEAREGRMEMFAQSAWFMSGGDRTKFLEKLKELSRFDYVDDALNLFAHKAQYIALSEFLEGMQTVLEKAVAGLTEDIANRKMKLSNPLELENKLNCAKREIAALRRKIEITVNDIFDRYAGIDGIIENKANQVVKEYLSDIERIDPNSSNSIDELEKRSFRRIDFFPQFEAELQKMIVAECDSSLIEYSEQAGIDYKVFKPDITREQVAKTRERLKSANTKEYEVEVGKCFDRHTETRTSLNQPKFFAAFKSSIKKNINETRNGVVKSLIDFVKAVTNKYSTELAKNLAITEAAYTQLQEEKKTTEEQLEIISRLELCLKEIEELRSSVDVKKEGVDQNVR